MNEFMALVSLLLHSPLIWIIVISCIFRCLFRPFRPYRNENLLTEKEYYHSLHTTLERFGILKLSGEDENKNEDKN